MSTKKKHHEASIFQRYYLLEDFKDRYSQDPSEAIDIIIPIIHTNEMWEANLRSIYREVPVNRLLIGDGGCIDDSIEIAKKYPRVVVFDHKQYKTLGFSIRKLIEEVETEWFAYLHSDVFLPEGWFDGMKKYKDQYDWYGCKMHITTLVECPDENSITKTRPFAGSQIGRKSAFTPHLSEINDDFVYRQEDYVFQTVVEKGGFKMGYVDDVFHYHQQIHKNSPWARKIKRVAVEMEWSPEELIRASTMQVYGTIKYVKPTSYLASWISLDIAQLMLHHKLNWNELRSWVAKTNPEWKPYLKYWRVFLMKCYLKMSKGNGMVGKLKKWFLK